MRAGYRTCFHTLYDENIGWAEYWPECDLFYFLKKDSINYFLGILSYLSNTIEKGYLKNSLIEANQKIKSKIKQYQIIHWIWL